MQRKVSIALGLLWTVIIVINVKVILRLYVNYQEGEAKVILWQTASSLLTFITTNLVLWYVIRTIKQQKKINEIKYDFISNMTHELKTPITIATSAIDAVLNHHGMEDKERAKLFLQTANDELRNLNTLIDRILNLSVASRLEIKLTLESVNLIVLLQLLIENHQLTARKKVDFDFIAQTQPVIVNADRLHLANALNNVLDNAIKYAQERVFIRIACNSVGKKAMISIQDNGIGIDRKYITEIFDPFFRVPHGNLYSVKGHGLGLSYVKNIIELHDGSIEVQSKLHKGSSFVIFLPVN